VKPYGFKYILPAGIKRTILSPTGIILRRKSVMKKLLFAVIVFSLVVTGLSAQRAGGGSRTTANPESNTIPGQWTIGARLGPVIGLSSLTSETEDQLKSLAGSSTGISIDEGWKGGFTLDFYGAYTINERLSIQAEFDFMFGQGVNMDVSLPSPITGDVSGSISYTTIDIPVFVKYALIEDPLIVGIQGGLHLSFPLGKAEADYSLTYSITSQGIKYRSLIDASQK
jgi:hypothetical protein